VAAPITEAAPPAPEKVWRIIGEAFHAYVIVECDDKLLLIDKHAAHERVLFEELRANLKKRAEATQILMVPLEVSLSGEEIATLEVYRTEVSSIGFSFTAGERTVSIEEIPEGLEPAEAAELLMTLAVTLGEGTGNAALSRDILFEKALYQGACKAAIKAGRDYPPEYTHWLCEQLQKLPDITVCPHGRPVAMELTHAYIDRQFKRS
jgi:DNA mismatch repair protein MutL